MTTVTKESLAEKIRYLESVSKLGLSLNEEYQLAAYRMLLNILSERSEEDELAYIVNAVVDDEAKS